MKSRRARRHTALSSHAGLFRRGLTVQMTNPKAALAWIAIVSLGLQDGAPAWVAAAIVGGTTALSMVVHAAYALLFSTRAMVRLYGRAWRPIQGAFAAFYAAAGVKLLISRA